jgi:hypothetical protein
MKTIPKKQIRQLEQELITEFVPKISRTRGITKGKSKANKGNPADSLGQIVLSYPVELAIVSKFAYDKTIEALVGCESDSSGAETFNGGSRDLIWYACSKSSVLSIKATLKEYGITNVKVKFYPPKKE